MSCEGSLHQLAFRSPGFCHYSSELNSSLSFVRSRRKGCHMCEDHKVPSKNKDKCVTPPSTMPMSGQGNGSGKGSGTGGRNPRARGLEKNAPKPAKNDISVETLVKSEDKPVAPQKKSAKKVKRAPQPRSIEHGGLLKGLNRVEKARHKRERNVF